MARSLLLTILTALLIAGATSQGLAQMEIGLGYNYPWGSQRAVDDASGIANSGWSQLTFEGLALYRPNTRWGYGLNMHLGQSQQSAAVLGNIAGSAIGTRIHRLEFAPTVEYRVRPWLSFDAGIGRSLTLSRNEQTQFMVADEEPIDYAVTAKDYNFGRAGITLHAEVAYLSFGVQQSFAHDVSSVRLPGTAAPTNLPAVRARAVDVSFGIRFGQADNKYGRALGVDSLLSRTFSPLEQRFEGWRVSLDPSYTLLYALGDRDLEFEDDGSVWRTAMTAAYQTETPWNYRGSVGFQRIYYTGFQNTDNTDDLQFSTTRTNNLELSVGAERAVWHDFAIGADLGGVVQLSSSVLGGQSTDNPNAAPRFREGAPLSKATALLMPYVRYYAGKRLSFDARAVLTLTSPYSNQLDTRLAVPATRSGRFVGGGLGISYALLR